MTDRSIDFVSSDPAITVGVAPVALNQNLESSLIDITPCVPHCTLELEQISQLPSTELSASPLMVALPEPSHPPNYLLEPQQLSHLPYTELDGSRQVQPLGHTNTVGPETLVKITVLPGS
jgi:hypothetical protein